MSVGIVRSLLVRSVFLMLILAAGCASQNAPMAELPTHDLDLSAPPAPPAAAPKAFSPVQPFAAAESNPWAVSNPRAWRYIVIHHSATEDGNAAEFDAQHRRRGWDELGYHFVIDNGRGGPDGLVEVGSRWKSQKWGAHTGGTPDNEYNNYGIGICLVGDFTHHLPTPAQLESLRSLVSYLANTYNIAPKDIIGHRDAPNASTQCPGAALERYVVDTLRWRAYVRYAYKN
jgi:N-acetyl-anhydromuramyl-L-alanine amidase AmpD